MFDLHYDLLTNILMRQNDIKSLKKYCNLIYNEKNIKGSIYNLFYMSPKEMREELGIKYEDIDIIKNLKKVNKIINTNKLISSNINYIYGIEGLDYLKKIEDIDILYELGVRSVNIVWNNENKFGTGVRGDKNRGLTNLGKELVEKIIRTNIAIDLSHANIKTFYDIIKECNKLKSYNPIVFASHSNCKRICNVQRNLTDNQILKIKELNGIIGIVSIKNFCTKSENLLDNQGKYEIAYIKNIKYINKLLNSIENISLSSDNMCYYTIEPEYYQNINIFKQNEISKNIRNLLKCEGYSNNEIDNIMFKNAENNLLYRLIK